MDESSGPVSSSGRMNESSGPVSTSTPLLPVYVLERSFLSMDILSPSDGSGGEYGFMSLSEDSSDS
uniref:Uncharacterized protein n=1 Tax=Cucumis melo TaxID=3656 RepID=A0A9I9DMK4_CUCME